MPMPRLTKLELTIMEALWTHGPSSIREIQERFPVDDAQAYTTVQTMVNRLETKKAVARVKKIGGAHIYEALLSRKIVQRHLIDEFVSMFGGRAQPIMTRFIETGKLTLEDIQRGEKLVRDMAAKGKKP
jgi:BlaI family penicillinase repressor